jgi:nicotinic acid mononucleotide adenylyltransferase
VPRIGYEIPDIDNEYWKRFKAVEIIPLQVMEVSSSEVRQRLSKGSGMDEMTLKEIADYIYKNKLYDSKL